MERGPKVIFGILVILAAAAGYGVYWWYGSAREVEKAPAVSVEVAKAIDDIRKLVMEGDLKSRSLVRKRVKRLKVDRRVDVLTALADDREVAVRLFAVKMLTRFRDRATVRALLAKKTLSDPDKDVKEAAKKALGGGSQ